MAVPGAVHDFTHLHSEEVRFDGDGFTMRGVLATPVESGERPGLLVLHDVFGVGEHYPDLALRFANLGYNALVPDLYSRTGPPEPGNREDLFAKHFGTPDRDMVTDLKHAARFLKSVPGTTKLGSIGFCAGGRWTLLLACNSELLDAAVDCWGGQLTHATPMGEETTEARPEPVIEMVDRLACPLLVVAGLEDIHPTPDEVRQLESRLRERAAPPAQVRYYEGAGHAFLNDTREFYREGPAHQAWADLTRFLVQHLK